MPTPKVSVEELGAMMGMHKNAGPVKAKGRKRREPGEMTGVETKMHSPIVLVIPGEPVSKPRMTQRDKWAQRPCVMKYRAWADKARAIAGSLPPTSRIASLDWVAYFEPAESLSAKKRAALLGKPHRNRPDRDNIDKATLDSLFTNDSGIARGVIQKTWDENARVEITITLEDSSLPDDADMKRMERGSVNSRVPKHGKPLKEDRHV